MSILGALANLRMALQPLLPEGGDQAPALIDAAQRLRARPAWNPVDAISAANIVGDAGLHAVTALLWNFDGWPKATDLVTAVNEYFQRVAISAQEAGVIAANSAGSVRYP